MTEKNVKSIIFKIILKLKTQRKELGYSHEYIANQLDISVSAYNKIERMETKLTLERFLLLKDILKMSISDFFDLNAENIYNQQFHDYSIAHQHQQIENLYQDNREITQNYIDDLKKEIEFLKGIIKNNIN